MKTLKLSNFTKLALGCLVVLSVACDKKGGDPAPAAPVAQYNYVNGSCYDVTTNTPVSQNLCANVLINGAYRFDGVTCRDANGSPVSATLCNNAGMGGINNGYRFNGVNCVDINNQVVAQTFCSQAGMGNGQYQILGGNCIHTYTGMSMPYSYCSGIAGYNPNQCSGTFIKLLPYGMTIFLECQGSNCSGQTLTEWSTGIQRTCP